MFTDIQLQNAAAGKTAGDDGLNVGDIKDYLKSKKIEPIGNSKNVRKQLKDYLSSQDYLSSRSSPPVEPTSGSDNWDILGITKLKEIAKKMGFIQRN